MYFNGEEDGEERFLNPELIHVVRCAITSNLEITPFGLRSVPTHTEDGIPIRKLYVSNLPPKTTRIDLFGVFAQYGFIKSCWLRMGDKGPNQAPTPTYAFVTYSNPEDAHKALQAPPQEKALRGRKLRVSPADSWHQPAEDATGRVRWKPRPHLAADDDDAQEPAPDDTGVPETSSDNGESSSEITDQVPEQEQDSEEETYNILDILNSDCLAHILTYVPIRDLIRSERVSKSWQNMIQDYLSSIRMFKTSWWRHSPVTLTTAVLRRVLQRLGPALLSLHIDHHWSALNDRTAHTVGKFCPGLEELKVVGMHTKNWNPLLYGCKQLKTLSFVSCHKLTDTSLVHLVKKDSSIESLTVANNTHVTGLFLTGANPPKLSSLAFYNCYGLQGTVLSAAVVSLPLITSLKLDVCPVTMWKMIPAILTKLPKLEELSLSEYTSVELSFSLQGTGDFCEALAVLTELKILNLSRNVYITNTVLKQVAQSCPKLESLNVSCCNSRKTFPNAGVSDEGILAICQRCVALQRLDVSYLAALSDSGAGGVARLKRLEVLVARGNAALTAAPLAAAIAACHQLREVDVCGCDNVCSDVVWAAARALALRPRPLTLRLAATAAATAQAEFPRHGQLAAETAEDRSDAQLRPDFQERLYADSDDELDDLYDHDFDDFLANDDDLFLDEDLEDYEGVLAYEMHGRDFILL